jgi:hypothetical protein
VLVLGLKPSEDGNGWIVRLFGASGKDSKVKLGWASAAPIKQWLSDSNEQRGAVLPDEFDVPAWGLVTVRAELGTGDGDGGSDGGPDAGADVSQAPDAGPDASTTPDAGGPADVDASKRTYAASNDSGCGCALYTRSSPRGALLAGFGLAALLCSRRRRRA